GTFHFPATFVTDRYMKIAGRIGAVDHTVGFSAADIAGGHNGWVDFIYIYRHPVIKHITFTFEVLSSRLNTVTDNSTVKFINVFEALLKQVGGGFLTFDTTGTVG